MEFTSSKGIVSAVYIFSTKLRIEIIERDVIDEEIKHRKSEHGVQLKLLSGSSTLQFYFNFTML